MYKLVALLLGLGFSKERGFLTGKQLTGKQSDIFDTQRKYLAKKKAFPESDESVAPVFLYQQCVLENCVIPEAMCKYAEAFSEQLKNGEYPILDVGFLQEIQTVTTDENREKEATFYLLHQIIESLAGAVFYNIRAVANDINSPDSDTEMLNLLQEATIQMEKINAVMGAFMHYMPREDFKMFRSSLGKASGAQSPLRFLDMLLFENFDVGPIEVLPELETRLPTNLRPVYQQIMREHANPTIYAKDNEIRRVYAPKFGADLKATFPTFLPEKLKAISTSILKSSRDVQKALLAFLSQRIAFKLHHVDIVTQSISKTSESGEPNLGTAGTPFAPFLRSSALRDIQLFTQVWKPQLKVED